MVFSKKTTASPKNKVARMYDVNLAPGCDAKSKSTQ
jgi:hypothetical protein